MDNVPQRSSLPPYDYNHQPAQYQDQYQYQNPVSDTTNIRDWLAWSIVNLIVGMGCFLPLIFSMICRSKKRTNNVDEARTMSKLALIFNIICTIVGIIGWVVLILYIVLIARAVKDINSSG